MMLGGVNGWERRVCQIAENRSRTIPDLVLITERPAEAADRAVPGHWEGDLIMGAGNRSAIITLVERSSRFVILQKVPYDHRAERVALLLSKAMGRLPGMLRRSLTWDQGREMAAHARFSVATGDPGVLLRPALALAARIEREHQRTAPPVLPERHRPVRSFPIRSQQRGVPHEQQTPRDTRIPQTNREAQHAIIATRRRCHRLKSPCHRLNTPCRSHGGAPGSLLELPDLLRFRRGHAG
jgi:hypothetical protein